MSDVYVKNRLDPAIADLMQAGILHPDGTYIGFDPIPSVDDKGITNKMKFTVRDIDDLPSRAPNISKPQTVVAQAPKQPTSLRVLIQEWDESERGWGVRPDGCSLHTSRDEWKRYCDEYWVRMRKQSPSAPDEYSRESCDPFWIEIYDPELIAEVMKEKSVRLWAHDKQFLDLRTRCRSEDKWNGAYRDRNR